MNPDKLARLPEVLFEIGKAIGSEDNLAQLLGHISQQVCTLADAEACSIMLLDASRERLLGKAAHGLARRDISLISFRVGEGIAGWVAQHGQPVLLDDVTGDPRYKVLSDSENRIRSLACVPLDCRSVRVGVVTITSSRIAAFDQGDLELLAFLAKTMALDIENVRLRRVSVTDPLTGAYNREFLQEHLPQELEMATRRGEPMAIAMVDVDHFKSVNDRLGHAAGDLVLAEVATRLRGMIRGDDRLVRYGGEEFVVILPRADAATAAEIGERMRMRLEEAPVVVEDEPIEVRISVGVAELRSDDQPSTLIRRADTALYAAKGRGRNRVEIAP
jgi:diguanylate cyclase (GGDEF)-like protein